MAFGYFTLIVALTISAVAEFYSIVGLTAIFSAAFWPVVIMGASLGIGKITAAVWLKLNWERASWTYKIYLVPAVAFLMLLTSMGIFGYLSKAHSDQSLVSGDAVAKVAIYDEKISTAKDNIATNRRALKQMDDAVDQVMGRSDDAQGADKAVAIRRGQAKERTRLLAEIDAEQKKISALSEERAPLAAEFRKVESEVGPIKYIAALVYSDNPDANVLEKAVRLVIIMIVLVFDPLALVLILAAQQSLRWAKEEKSQPNNKFDQFEFPEPKEIPPVPETIPVPVTEPSLLDQHPYLTQPFVHFKNLTPMVHKSDTQEANEVVEQAAVETPKQIDIEHPGDYLTPPDDEETPEVQDAMRQWKALNPGDTLKHQRNLLERGDITELPWMKLIADNELPESTNTGFGTAFPATAVRGDTFVRVDRLPSVVYKYNGKDWMEVDKNLTDSYTYDNAYIDHLIERLASGEYDAELLSETEREQVAQRLQSNTNT